MKKPDLEAQALVGAARCHALEGRGAVAVARLGEVPEAARRASDADGLALAACLAAALPGGDPAAAARTLEELGTRPWPVARMEARWWLWKATGDRPHLAEAWRLLVHLRDRAPEKYRETILSNVPLHRDIAAAAKEAGL